jgi:hypothetical protein
MTDEHNSEFKATHADVMVSTLERIANDLDRARTAMVWAASFLTVIFIVITIRMALGR